MAIIIKYSKQDGIIKPNGIKFHKYQDENIILPKIAIGIFSRHLFEYVINNYSCEEVGYMSCANFEKKIYILTFKNAKMTVFMAGISSPVIAGDIEELFAQGVKTFIIFGNCGVLDSKIKDKTIIIPIKGFREEGTSYHYVFPKKTIKMNPKYQEDFIKLLNKNNFSFYKGYTWTTDAFYRETFDKIKYFKRKGAICVEMEGTAIAAVSKRIGANYFTFYYAGDCFNKDKWNSRSLNSSVDIEKKINIVSLVLEFALLLSNKIKK